MDGTALDTLLRDFALEQKLQGRSQATTVLYQRAMRQLCAFAGVDDPAKLTRDHVAAWSLDMATRMAPNTRRIRLLGAKVFLDWARKEPGTGVTENVAAGVPIPSVPVVPRQIPTAEEIQALLSTLRGRTFLTTRDLAMILLLIDTGLRRSELSAVNLDDLDMDRQILTVRRGKGGRFRRVAYGDRTALAVSRYLRFRRTHQGASEPALLLSIRPDKRGSYRLSDAGIAMALTRRCEDAGIAPITCHQLRHLWADRLARSGMRETELTYVGGWSARSAMPKLYGSALAEERALEAQRKASPVQGLLDPAE